MFGIQEQTQVENQEFGNNDNKTEFIKNGQSIIRTNFEKKYLDIGEKETVIPRLENTFNLKLDLIDDNPNNFYLDLGGKTNLSTNRLEITAIDYGTNKIKVVHQETGREKEITVIVAMKMESIVQGFRDVNFADGEYSVVVKDQPYTVELINIYGDTRYSLETTGETEDNEQEKTRIVSLGDRSTEHKTLVVKYHGNLTIDKGVTVTASTSLDAEGNETNLTYKKGMYLCVLGDIINNGEISMTARGTYNQERRKCISLEKYRLKL